MKPSLEKAVIYQINNPVNPKKEGIDNGYCVDLVKYYRDIPWNGDARYYYQNAIEYGFEVGNVPKLNAILVSTSLPHGHVSFIISVLEESFTVIEQNVIGRHIVSSRIIPIESGQLFVY